MTILTNWVSRGIGCGRTFHTLWDRLWRVLSGAVVALVDGGRRRAERQAFRAGELAAKLVTQARTVVRSVKVELRLGITILHG